jgi:hypothetical protein
MIPSAVGGGGGGDKSGFFCPSDLLSPYYSEYTNDEPQRPQALVSFKKYMPPPLPYFKVNMRIPNAHEKPSTSRKWLYPFQ